MNKKHLISKTKNKKNPLISTLIYFLLIVKLKDFYSFAIYGKSRDELAIARFIENALVSTLMKEHL